MPSEESRVNKQESTRIVSQAEPVAPSRQFTPPLPSANAIERAVSQSPCVSTFNCHDLLLELIWAYRVSLSALIDSHNLVITGGQFNHAPSLGHHINLAIHFNREHCLVSALLTLSKTQHQKEVQQ